MAPKTKWYSLRAVSRQLSRKGVGRTNLITILKQEGLIQDDKQPKPALVSKGFFQVKEHFIKPSDRSMVTLKTIQISDQGINYIRAVLEKRDIRINTCILRIQKIAELKKVFIRTKINAI